MILGGASGPRQVFLCYHQSMTQQADAEARNRKLDELKTAIEEWYDEEEAKIQYEIDFLKGFLRGRTGSERLERATTQRAGLLAYDDVRSLLGGE